MIKLRELSIQAFRGVPDRVTLDLSSPITVIYAPNGSGKTSICEAVEWLLTGTVRRLESLTPEHEGIRCRFSDHSTPTLVSAELEVDGEPIALERKPSGCRWRLGKDAWRAVTQADLLERIAPSAVEEGVHRSHANRSRQMWLHGTRFLSGEALAALLDSDSDSVTVRQRLFADLLGVGHLLETERQLDSYITELDKHLDKQQARLDDKDAEVKDRETKLTVQIEENSKDSVGAAIRYIHEAHVQLGLNGTKLQLSTPASALSAIANIRASLEGRKALWDQKREAELRISSDWAEREAIAKSQLEDQARLSTLSTEERTNNASLLQPSDQLRAATAAVDQSKRNIELLEARDAALKQAQAQVEPLLREYLRKLGSTGIDTETALSIAESEGADEARRARLLRDADPIKPRLHVASHPYPPPGLISLALISTVLPLGVFRPIEGETVPHQPLPEIGPANRARRHGAPVTIETHRRAVHRALRDEGVKIVRRLRAAAILQAVIAPAKLAALRRIDSPEPDPSAVDFQRIPIDDAGPADHIVRIGAAAPGQDQQQTRQSPRVHHSSAVSERRR